MWIYFESMTKSSGRGQNLEDGNKFIKSELRENPNVQLDCDKFQVSLNYQTHLEAKQFSQYHATKLTVKVNETQTAKLVIFVILIF